MPGRAVAAAADRQLQPRVAGQRDDPDDVSRVGGLDDHLGVAVEATVEGRARLVVGGIVRHNHSAAQLRTQSRDQDAVQLESIAELAPSRVRLRCSAQWPTANVDLSEPLPLQTRAAAGLIVRRASTNRAASSFAIRRVSSVFVSCSRIAL